MKAQRSNKLDETSKLGYCTEKTKNEESGVCFQKRNTCSDKSTTADNHPTCINSSINLIMANVLRGKKKKTPPETK